MTETADPGHVEHRVVAVDRKRMAQLRRGEMSSLGGEEWNGRGGDQKPRPLL